MKKALSLFLVFLLIISFDATIAFAEEEAVLQKTVISGISKAITAPRDAELVRTLTIEPSDGGRTVKLQLYSSEEEEYKTICTYETEDEPSAELEIVIPKKWRKRRTGNWRIIAEESETAEKAEKCFTLTTRNIVNKKLNSKSACVYCIEDKKSVYGKKMHDERKQASTTKIMTAILFLESGKVNSSVKISKAAAKTPYSYIGLTKGDYYAAKDLFYSLMLCSSNGAAVALGECVSSSSSAFVKSMNSKAKELGLKNTHYANPNGLDSKNHYSSAYDISIEMAYIYPKSLLFRKVIASSSHSFKTKKLNKKIKVTTTDKLKGYSKGHKGGKTGFTTPAGYCYTSIYSYKGKTYAVTILGASSEKNRWNDVKKLYSYIDEYASTGY